MAQLIKKKFIGDKQVDGSKILLDEVKSVKVVDSTLAEIDLIKLDGSDNVVLSNDVIVEGNLTVNGATTTIQSQTLEVVDANILVNKDGTQSTANVNGAGLTVSMSDAVDAKIAYDSSLASKFKIGEEGSEAQVVTVSHAQSLTNKTIDADSNTISNLEVDNLKSGVLNTSSSLAGASDAQVPSALAVKSYVDTEIGDLDAVYHKIGGQAYAGTAAVGSTDASDILVIRNSNTRLALLETSTQLSAPQDLSLTAENSVAINQNSELRIFVGDFDTQIIKPLVAVSPDLTQRIGIIANNPDINGNAFHQVWAQEHKAGSFIEFGAFASTDVSGGTVGLTGSRVRSSLAGSGSYTSGDVRVETRAQSDFDDQAADLAISSGGIQIQTAGAFVKGALANASSGSILIQTGAKQGTGTRGSVTLAGLEVVLNPESHASLSNKQIKNLAAPTDNNDAATKLYVDDAAAAVAQDLVDHINAVTGAHAASAISVSPAVNGQANVQLALENHESRIDVLESAVAPVFFKEKFAISTSSAPSTLTLTHTPLANSIVAFVDRLAIHEGVGEDYTVSGNVITILNPGNGNGQIGNGDNVYVTYQYIP